jgi:hypothetical protein
MHDGILDGSTMLTGRHFAGKEYRGGFAVKLSALGRGVVSHAGVGFKRELPELTGLSAQFTAVWADTYRAVHNFERLRRRAISG